MVHLLGLILISFAITSFFMVPFIDFLFYLKRKFEKNHNPQKEKSELPIHDALMKDDENVPSGGGVLLIIVVFVLSLIYSVLMNVRDQTTLKILLFSFISI